MLCSQSRTALSCAQRAKSAQRDYSDSVKRSTWHETALKDTCPALDQENASTTSFPGQCLLSILTSRVKVAYRNVECRVWVCNKFSSNIIFILNVTSNRFSHISASYEKLRETNTRLILSCVSILTQ